MPNARTTSPMRVMDDSLSRCQASGLTIIKAVSIPSQCSPTLRPLREKISGQLARMVGILPNVLLEGGAEGHGEKARAWFSLSVPLSLYLSVGRMNKKL